MVAITHPVEVRLAARGLYEIPDAAGVRITCRRGAVWLTLDDDPRDIVLEAGDSFCAAEHRRALISAFSTSDLVVAAAPARTQSPPPAWRGPARSLTMSG